MGECGGVIGGFEFGKGLSHSRKPELAQLVERRMGKQDHLPNGNNEVRGYWGGGAAHRWWVAVAGFGDRACCRGSSALSRKSACRSRSPAWRQPRGDRHQMTAPAAQCRGRRGSLAQDGVGAPGSARIKRQWLGH